MPSTAIFELGLNHLGDIGRGRRMIEILQAQGATHLTLQMVVDPLRFTRNLANAQSLRPNCLTLGENLELISHAKGLGLHPGATIVDPGDVPQLVEAGVEFFKVLSSDLSFELLHRTIASTNLPMYLSTGAATIPEIGRAVDTLRVAEPSADIRLIHTVLEVPTPASHINLANISLLAETFGIPVAYGQHSDVREAAVAACVAGAETIFVYVAEERLPNLPDGPHAILCTEVSDLLQKCELARTLVGTRERRLQPAEESARSAIRRSIVAARRIRAGEFLTERDVAFKRPGTGCEPWDFTSMVGKRADRDYEVDEDISLNLQ